MCSANRVLFAQSGLTFFLCLLACRPIAAQPQYTITDFGAARQNGVGVVRASLINNRGQVAGTVLTRQGDTHACLWEQGKTTDLGTLGGNYSEPFAISNIGQIVGISNSAHGDQHAFLWQQGEMRDLGTLGGRTSHAYCINDLGQVLGLSEAADGKTHAFLWQQGKLQDLGGVGAMYGGYYLNNHGQALFSEADGPAGPEHVYLWEKGHKTDIGTLGGKFVYPIGLDDMGRVLGDSSLKNGEFHYFVWEAGKMTDIGAVPRVKTRVGNGYAVFLHGNNALEAVGSLGSVDTTMRAVVYRHGVVIDLNTLISSHSGWTLTFGMSLNDNGQIICSGKFQGSVHTCLLTPIAK